MSKQIRKGNLPVNARVDIDYTGEKPKIKFSYPKKNVVGQNLVGIHTYILFFIWIIIYAGAILKEESMTNNPLPYPVNCNITINQTNYYSEVKGQYMETQYNFTINNSYLNSIDLNCRDNNQTLILDSYNNLHTKSNISISDRVIPMAITFGSLIIIILLNWLITKYLVKQQWYKSWLPKHQAKSARRKLKYFKFLPQDVENNMVMIPKFANVTLEYKAEGDFSKQLTNLKIREHQYFKFKKGKKVGKLQKKIYDWSAKFFFKDKPKSGYLEVVYY
jgi:hypothetical protein